MGFGEEVSIASLRERSNLRRRAKGAGLEVVP
jgi:hypothetical protein